MYVQNTGKLGRAKSDFCHFPALETARNSSMGNTLIFVQKMV
jgi:hypothetical protein